MKNYLAVVSSANNKVTKYMDFDTKSAADAHVAKFGGFVVDTPSGHIDYWVVNSSNKTVTFDKSTSDSNAASKAATAYKEKRRREYPSYADQFDLLYHGGIDAWKAEIKKTKDKYPK
tara:strand:- start:637 stop:987 length:351 start_codon:yes stop_codon:yes gene_type:complete